MNRKTLLLVAPVVLVLGGNVQPSGPRFERVYPLKPEEGVFAYSRISPDGRFLAYASEYRVGGGVRQTVTVVDLKEQKILFTEPGIDAYWSHDGKRMIYLSFENGRGGVSLRNHETGEITRNVAPQSLGDYFSWAVRNGRNLILTIQSNYYYLNGNNAEMPNGSVPPCEGIGRGERPLISKDGMRITTFVRGTVVVRNLTDCDFILDTGIRGAKADFSWDNRYIAFHAQKEKGDGYEIQVVDLKDRTVRTVTNLPGSSLFPSWTKDGRLSFRYDGDDYRGFMFALDPLSSPAKPLPGTNQQVPQRRTWSDVFPETKRPAHALNLVLVWGSWSAHSPMALQDMQRARDYFARYGLDVGVTTATDPGSIKSDVDRMVAEYNIHLPSIALAPQRLQLTEAHNQIPTTLLFRAGELVDRKLGAQSFEQLREWVETARK